LHSECAFSLIDPVPLLALAIFHKVAFSRIKITLLSLVATFPLFSGHSSTPRKIAKPKSVHHYSSLRAFAINHHRLSGKLKKFVRSVRRTLYGGADWGIDLWSSQRRTVMFSVLNQHLRLFLQYFQIMTAGLIHRICRPMPLLCVKISGFATARRQYVFPPRPTGWPNKFCTFCFVYALTSSNTDQFSSLFHCKNRKKICTNTIYRPQVCRYTTLGNVTVLKATTENKTSVTTHFKKLTAGNNMFLVSVIV